MKRIGFFGGTFDPIHFGHLNLAIHLFEKKGLDQVLFSPASISPGKTAHPPIASKKARKEMTLLAIEDISYFSLFDFELQNEGPSYTIDAVQHLLGQNADFQLQLILGEDVLPGLAHWKDIRHLLKLSPVLVGARPFEEIVTLPRDILSLIDQGRVDIPMMEISSRELRERLIDQQYCGHLVPAKVLDYIRTHDLY